MKSRVVAAVLLLALVCDGGAAQVRRRDDARPASSRAAEAASALNGVYRIDLAASDKLYTVVAGATSNLPFAEQQRFFIDLAVRLTPPDLLAIERRGRRILIGSSRAPRVTLQADGATHDERAVDGHLVRTRAALEGDRLVFTARGRAADDFSVIFAPVADGRRLRVTRRISAEQLNEPVVIQTFYDKISDVAQWNIYGEPLVAGRGDDSPARAERGPAPARDESGEAAALRAGLSEWVDATNGRDIERQMDFYMPEVKAFYLARNVARAFVRAEKARAFATATAIEVRAEEPEIIFRDGARTAIMRFRKKYRVEDGRESRRGEVIQELRWQRTGRGWKIFSERDVRVIR